MGAIAMSECEVAALRILVVDDDTNVRKALAVSLETDGHTTVAVSNGPDALAEASRQHFDVAFVDLRLKTASGLDLIPALLARSPWLQIVIITAHDSPSLREECMNAGAIEYLCKPLDIRALVKAVSQVMPSAG